MKKPVKIDFCDIGINQSKTDYFLHWVLAERFDLKLCDQPDFLVHNLFGHAHRLHSGVRVLFTGESDAPDYNVSDYSISPLVVDDPRHLHLPAYVVRGSVDKIIKQQDDPERILASKPKFCGFMVSTYNPRKNQHRPDFFQLLSRYKKVDSGGKLQNNIGRVIPYGAQHKAEFLRPYKFNICFENASKPGYATEKIYDAMACRCLPIYWGDPLIGQQFNPRSFLNRADFPSDEALVEKIIELDQDDAKYMEFMRQPYLPDDKPTPFFDRNRICDFFEKIISTPITPVAQRRRGKFSLGRWVAAKRYHWHPFPKPYPIKKFYDRTDGFWDTNQP